MVMLRLKELVGLKFVLSVCSSFTAAPSIPFDRSFLGILHPHFRDVSKIDYLLKDQMSEQDLDRIMQVAQDNYHDNYLLMVPEKNHLLITARDRAALGKFKTAWMARVLD